MIRYSIYGPWCEVNTPEKGQFDWLPWWKREKLEPCLCYNCQHYDTVGGFIWMADAAKGIRFNQDRFLDPPVVSPARSGLEWLARQVRSVRSV